MVIPENIQAYASAHTSQLSPLLTEILEFTLANHAHPQMISSHEQGLFLQFLSSMKRPKRILEIGTFTGFSGLCLASGLTEDGELHTLELREEDAATAKAYFARSPLNEKIHLHIGNALETISSLNEQWDIVFIDADKTGYIDYYNLVLPNLAPGGIIIADNVLFHGDVVKEPLSGKNAKAIDAFNKHVKNDDSVEQVMLTVRDGLLLVRKKK